MSGINLASSTLGVKKYPRKGFDRYFAGVIIIFFLVFIGFAGLRLYIKALESQLSRFDESLQESANQLRGEKVDRAGRFDERLSLIGKQLESAPVDSQKLLSQLEGLVIPDVTLTKYNYDEVGKFVQVAGEADSFKSVARQIISFKSDQIFERVKVESLYTTKEGRVKFSLKAEFN